MSSYVINLERREDIQLFESLAKRLGLIFFKLSDDEKRMVARRELVDKMSDVDPDTEVPEDLIFETVEEIRSKRYAENQVSH